MLRYSLDNLGWADFERLIQFLLKTKFGFGIEAWGGSGDHGRDAYFSGHLDYPSKGSQGVYVFQAKFVEAANAAGARPRALILNAIRKEAARIEKRRLQGEAAPTHYSLFTNVTCSPDIRDDISKIISIAFNGQSVGIHIHDGGDTCIWLDSEKDVARSFPTILGFRDLEDLLRDRIDRTVIERSRAALEGAANLAKVFVPTKAYYRALEFVGKKSFLVLAGAPEAGKTAIGRMICLAQHARGWEVIECRDPEDVLRQYESHRSQCFFADDFFGRTEFDTSRAKRWEADLSTVLKKMNEHHWLLLTSRAHILHFGERAIDADTDIQFPKASEVTVDATTLTREERARILYRHAKAADLSPQIKDHVRSAAWAVTGLSTFTPERARRLVQEFRSSPQRSASDVQSEAEISFKHPSEKSTKTFRNLPESHKWYLFSLLEEPDYGKLDRAAREEAYLRLCHPDHCIDPKRVETDLLDAFLSAETNKWAHPSYRDVAIDELADNPTYRSQFLNNCNAFGIKLATSWFGGITGVRRLPLLKSERDWNNLTKRTGWLAMHGADVLSILIQARQVGLKEGLITPPDDAKIAFLINTIRTISTAHNNQDNSFESIEAFLSVDDGTGVPVDWHSRINKWCDSAKKHLDEDFVPWQMLPTTYSLEKLLDMAITNGVDPKSIYSPQNRLDKICIAVHQKLQTYSPDWDGYGWETGSDARDASSEYGDQIEKIRFFGTLASDIGLQKQSTEILGFMDAFEEAQLSLGEYAESLPRYSDRDEYDDERFESGADSTDFTQHDVESLFADL